MDKRSGEQLKNESLKSVAPSSFTHAVDAFADELKEYKGGEEYFVPDRYFVNKIVLLPVNSETGFFYWEITADYIIQICDREVESYVVKILDASDASSLQQFDIHGQKGSHYFASHNSNKKIYAVMGVYDKDGNFIEFLRSNIIKMPSDYIIESEDSRWISDLEEWSELLSYSLDRVSVGSSDTLIKENENLKRYKKLRMELENRINAGSVSSGEFLGSSSMSSFILGKK